MPRDDSRDTGAPLRVVLYSHDSVGLGHTRRNLALAHALAAALPERTGRSVTGLLLSSLSVPAHHLPRGFDLVAVPSIGKSEGVYQPRHLDVATGEVIELRSQILRAAVLGFGPDLMIIDRHVRGLHGELDPALATIRRHRPGARVVLGLRDVLDDPATATAEWAAMDLRAVRRHLDAIWVYGDPAVHDLRGSGELPAELADLVDFTGYLSVGRQSFADSEHTRPYVLTMVGGGSDGSALCRTAAAAPVPPGHTHLIVTGPQMSAAERAEVCARAAAHVQVVDSVPDGLHTIRGASAVVSMAGYNTITEVMAGSTPLLLVPREQPRREQLIRSRALARAGCADLIRARDLTSAALGAWLATAVTADVDRTGIDRSGLAAVGDLAADLLGYAHADLAAPIPVPTSAPIPRALSTAIAKPTRPLPERGDCGVAV